MAGNPEAEIIISSDEDEEPTAVVSIDVLNEVRTQVPHIGVSVPSLLSRTKTSKHFQTILMFCRDV